MSRSFIYGPKGVSYILNLTLYDFYTAAYVMYIYRDRHLSSKKNDVKGIYSLCSLIAETTKVEKRERRNDQDGHSCPHVELFAAKGREYAIMRRI